MTGSIRSLGVTFAAGALVLVLAGTRGPGPRGELTGQATPLFVPVPDAAPVLDRAASRGVAWGDVDDDGDPDLYVARSAGHRSMLYRNDGGRFTRLDDSPLSVDDGNSEGAVFVDLDGDGDLDFYALNRSGRAGLLFRNLGAGRFEPMNDAVLSAPRSASMACFADLDLDGDLDAFIVGYRGSPNVLAINDGGGRFSEGTLPPTARGSGEGRTCAWGDVGGDGRPDLFLGNAQRPNVLLQNTGSGALEPLSHPHLDTHVAYTYGSSWADIDDDGDLDLFVANFDADNVLYVNEGGRLRPQPADRTPQSAASKGHSWGDFDLDGALDLYLGSGTPGPDMVNALWLGDGRGGFSSHPVEPWLAHADTSAGIAAADYDLDGRLDLFVANWGGARSVDRLYHGLVEGGAWASIRLWGTRSNRRGIGARVSVLATIDGTRRWQTRVLSTSTGYAGQDDSRIHFGLGDAQRIDSLVVTWPSGVVDRHGPRSVPGRWIVTEGGVVGDDASGERH